MAHQRKLIRKAVADLLVAANTAAGSRVKTTRVDPLTELELPSISVYTLGEDVDPDSANTAPIELTRKLKLEVTGFVMHTDALSADDAMDDLAEQIEAAMAADYYIGSNVVDQLLESTEMQVVEGGSSDPLVGVVTLTYAMTYRTYPVEVAAVATDDFLRGDAKYQVTGGVADTPIVEDTFNVQET